MNLIKSNKLQTTPGYAGGLAVNAVIKPPADTEWEDYEGPDQAHPSSLAANVGIVQPLADLVWEDYETGAVDRGSMELAINRASGNRFKLAKLNDNEIWEVYQTMGLNRVVQPADQPGEWVDC